MVYIMKWTNLPQTHLQDNGTRRVLTLTLICEKPLQQTLMPKMLTEMLWVFKMDFIYIILLLTIHINKDADANRVFGL